MFPFYEVAFLSVAEYDVNYTYGRGCDNELHLTLCGTGFITYLYFTVVYQGRCDTLADPCLNMHSLMVHSISRTIVISLLLFRQLFPTRLHVFLNLFYNELVLFCVCYSTTDAMNQRREHIMTERIYFHIKGKPCCHNDWFESCMRIINDIFKRFVSFYF